MTSIGIIWIRFLFIYWRWPQWKKFWYCMPVEQLVWNEMIKEVSFCFCMRCEKLNIFCSAVLVLGYATSTHFKSSRSSNIWKLILLSETIFYRLKLWFLLRYLLYLCEIPWETVSLAVIFFRKAMKNIVKWPMNNDNKK